MLPASLNVLVAEDNVINQKVITRLLASLGVTPVVVADGNEAVTAIQSRAEAGRPFDIVLMLMKAYDATWAARLIEPYLAADGLLIGVQNGMTAETIAEIVGAQRTLGCVIEVSSEMDEPGVVMRHTPAERSWFALGPLAVGGHPRLEEAAAVLRCAGAVSIVDDILSAKWMKLIANIPEMLPSGLLGVPLLEAAHMPGIRPVMDAMSREAYALAIDLGITMLPSLGIAAEDVPDSDQYSLDLLDRVLSHFSKPDTRVAVLQDWEKGRRAELDAFSGYIVAQAHERGHPAPVNEAILRLAERVEGGELAPSPENAPQLTAALYA